MPPLLTYTVCTPITQIKVGDVISVTVGGIFEDELYRVFGVRRSKGLLFDDECIEFLIGHWQARCWREFAIYGQYGNKPRFEHILYQTIELPPQPWES